MQNGTLLWKYSRSCGLNAPWGNYPIFIAAIADGKVYAFNNEHSPNAPYYKDYRVHCLDAFTGKLLWTIMGWAGQTGGRGLSTSVVADGFLVYYNYYDNQIYCIGKGPSATRVSASPKVVAKGSSVLIEGRVTDISPGTTSDSLAKRFPEGVPAVADECMGPWMEYLYMQKPAPKNITGVDVTLQAISPNGAIIDIAKVTCDGYGSFKYLWTPPDEGTYTIMAIFAGSNSYWPSYAQTHIGVTAAPPAPAAAEQAEFTQILVTALIVIAVVCLCLVAYDIHINRKMLKQAAK
jgi:hypothetical protein